MEKTKIVNEIIINPETMGGTYAKAVEDADYQRIAGTYLHGVLQDDNGFDIFNIIGTVPNCTGVFQARILGRAENDNKATFFLWQSTYKESNFFHGLVVLNRDKAALRFARNKYKAKTSHL